MYKHIIILGYNMYIYIIYCTSSYSDISVKVKKNLMYVVQLHFPLLTNRSPFILHSMVWPSVKESNVQCWRVPSSPAERARAVLNVPVSSEHKHQPWPRVLSVKCNTNNPATRVLNRFFLSCVDSKEEDVMTMKTPDKRRTWTHWSVETP